MRRIAQLLTVTGSLWILCGCSTSTTVTTYKDTSLFARRTIVRKADGVKRMIESNKPIEFRDARPVAFEAGTIIRLTESRGFSRKRAELREADGELELWVKRAGQFHAATSAERAWWDRFLDKTGVDDREPEDVAKAKILPSVGQPGFRAALKNLDEVSFADERVAVLDAILGQASLTPQDQVAVVGAVFEYLTYDEDRRKTLLKLINRSDFAPEARVVLVDRIDEIGFDSTKVTLQQAMLRRMD